MLFSLVGSTCIENRSHNIVEAMKKESLLNTLCLVFGICLAVADNGPAGVPCNDKRTSCKAWAAIGHCKTNKVVVKLCPKSCKRFDICGGPSLQPTEPSGVSITEVKALNSTSLQVSWNSVSVVNDTISSYTVCYALSSPVDCSIQKTVDGSTTSTIVTGLNEFTTYYVAVKASSTSGGDGPLGTKMEETTFEDVPAKGPTITSITPTARSLKVTWNKLSSDDSNGQITKYEVFYQLGSAVSISSAKRTLTGVDNTTVELTGLKPATMYTVAVRAFTPIGFGPLGDPMSQTTSESVPAKGPTITSITPTARSLKVTWNRLSSDDSNGEITKYEVFYQLGSIVSISSAKRTVTGVDNTMVNLTGLKPATMYTVAVRAFTKIGRGPLGDPTSQTTNERVPGSPVIDRQSLNVASTSISFKWLVPLEPNGVILKYRVCWWRSRHDALRSCHDTRPFQPHIFTIPDLKPGNLYIISVVAFTKIGAGPPASVARRTDGSGLNMRLWGRYPYRGYVQVKNGSTWRYVIDKNWNKNRQKMLCRNLGFKKSLDKVHSGRCPKGTKIASGDFICHNTKENQPPCRAHLQHSIATGEESVPYAQCKICNKPLLIHTRTFPNKVFSGRGGSDYHNARFSGSGWCAPISGSYLLIDLQKEYHITRVAIMGNVDQTKWSSSYAMQYSQTKASIDDGPSVQITGNNNGYQASITKLKVYNARYIKIKSTETGSSDFCIRIELCGKGKT